MIFHDQLLLYNHISVDEVTSELNGLTVGQNVDSVVDFSFL